MDLKGVNQLLERYRNGQCTVEERKAVEEWFDTQAAKGDWEWSEPQQAAAGKRIKNNIDQQLFESRPMWPLLRIAAILFLVVGSALLFRGEIRNWADPVVMLEKKVGDGKQFKLSLPDGSVVLLNAGSKFSYPNRFTQGKRQVYLLEGEAYFEVSHDAAHPFIVTSKNINTRVLGTAFNVKAYRYLSNLQVSVTRGKVRVSDTTGINSAILMPGEQLTIDGRSGSMSKRLIDMPAITAWQRGDFSFNNDRLIDVCAALSKKFKLSFQFREKEIEDYRITAGFVAKDNIDDILSILASANNLLIDRKGQTVTFRKQ